VLGRDLVMVPKLIHPLPPNEPRTPRSSGEEEDIEEEPPTPHPLNDTWMQVRCREPKKKDVQNTNSCSLRRALRVRRHARAEHQRCSNDCATVTLLAVHEGPCLVAQAINEERPPTPPRGRPPNQGNSLAFFE
jgi:hypothetical protein